MSDEQDIREWHILGQSVRGASHNSSGMLNQDRILWRQAKTSTGVPLVMAIADGHGSEKHFRSHIGAQFAVEVAEQEIHRFVRELPDLSTITNFATIKYLTEQLPQSILYYWRETVEKHWHQNRYTEEEWKWLNDKANAKARYAISVNSTLPYGATLLTVLVTKSFILYLQLGDGDILTVSETGEVTRPIPGDKRLLANETTSLCTATVKDFRSNFQLLSDAPPALILLSTDGYANSFRDEEGFLKVGSDIWSIVQKDGIEKVDADLRGWLTSATRTGSGDDITLGILCRMSALNKVTEDSCPGNMNKATASEKSVFSLSSNAQVADAREKTRQQQILIVSQAKGTQYRSIREALDDAEPNAQIRIQPGVYEESFIIDKSVEIVGERSDGKVVIESQTPCVKMDTANAIIKNITLRGKIGPDKNAPVIDIPQGKLVLNDCDISSESMVCISIYGNTAYPDISGCHIHHGKGKGIVFNEYAQGLVKNCKIESNMGAAVELKGRSTPIIQNCWIYDGKGIGIFARDNCEGKILDCVIYGNDYSGIEIRKNGNPLVQRCQINNCKGHGILIDESGQGKVIDCEIFGNMLAGIEIQEETSNLLIQRCKIFNGEKSGITVDNKGRGTIEGCEIRGNSSAGIEIKHASNVAVYKCAINDNATFALQVHGTSQVTAEGCNLQNNRVTAWDIDPDCCIDQKNNIE